MKKYFLLLILLIVSCKEKTIDVGNYNSFVAERNISYGENSEQKLDLYSPKTKDSIKGIFLFIHGGGWKAGDKSQLTSLALSMMEKFPDYAFANMNYRLAYEKRFAIPNQTDDISKAITFLNLKFKNNPHYILLGNSAGGHLSMLYSYQFNDHQKIKAVVNIVGPSDLSDVNFRNYSDYSFVEKHLVDISIIPKDKSTESFGSPINWITEKSAPTISFYGNSDQVIPLSQKKILDSVLNMNNVYNKSYEFSGGHLDWDNNKNSPSIINSIAEFLKFIDKK